MPPSASTIDLGISWNAIVGGINAFTPALSLPAVLGIGATIAIGIIMMTLSMVKRGFSRR